MIFKPFCSTEIVFANVDTMKEKLLAVEAKNVALIASESSVKRLELLFLVEELADRAEQNTGSFTWVKDISANPNIQDVKSALDQLDNQNIDLYIAIGGGSAMDMAKAISAFQSIRGMGLLSGDQIKGAIIEKQYEGRKFADIIALPTTSGTGSEVTQWATVWDEEDKKKYSIDDPKLKPKLAIIVPEFTLSMSALLTLGTGLDAMCQATESFWSVHTTPIVQEIATQAIRIIVENLRKAIDEPANINVRENLCKASVLAGLAFSQTRTTACHSISYPLTLFHGIPHGIAAVITLDAVSKINKGYFPNDDQLFKLFDEYGDIAGFIKYVSDGVLEMRLKTFGITEADTSKIVDYAFTGGRMDNNPIELSREDVRRVLESVL